MAEPKLSIEISAKLDSLDRDFSRVSNMARDTANKVEGAFGGLGSSLKAGLAGIAATLSVGVFANVIKSAVDAQDHLNDLSKSTALSVETLAGLGSAARKSGGDLDSIAAAVNKLSVNMGKEPEKYRAIGIAAKDPIEALKQLADVFVAIKDPQERAAFAAAALGRSWAGTAPLLSEGGKALGEMVEKGARLSKVTAESAAKADELNDRLEDLETSSLGLKVALANALVPSLSETARAMEEIMRTGNPFAVMMSGIGRQRLTFDPGFASAAAQVKDLEKSVTDLQEKSDFRKKFDKGVINDWLYGKQDDIDQKLTVTRNQLEALKKFGDKLNQPPAAPAAPAGPAPDVAKFLDDDRKKKISEQISDGQRLIQQLRDRLAAQDQLTEVEKISASFAADRYKKISEGEKDIALQLAAQFDARSSINKELDAELDRVKEVTKVYDAQDARLKSLIASTDIGKNTQNMLDEALAESALNSGKIDLSTYDQIIEKMHEVKDEGKDGFQDLQRAIEGWGRASADAIVQFAMTGKMSFRQLADAIIADMIRIAAQEQITKPMAKAFGSFDWGGLFSSFGSSSSVTLSDGTSFASAMSANGNVFSSPALSAYSGKIVSTPTVFPFARGIGLMGEAGPEAIMPLKRGPDGKLGVSGGGANVQVNVIESPGSDKNGQTEQRQSGGMTIIDVFIEQIKGAVANDIGTGGIVSKAIEGQYGVNRAAGAWR